MKQYIANLAVLLIIIGLTFTRVRQLEAGAPTSGQTWGGTYEADPLGTDPLNEGDDWINQLKTDIRLRAAVEHDWGNLSGAPTTDFGRHLEGSARGFYEAACPITFARGDYQHGAAAGTILDEGRFCRDSVTGELKINSAAGNNWVQALTALSGTINLLGATTFTDAGADAMDIHNHAEGATGRHRLTGSGGLWVNAVDGIPFAIQAITRDTSLDAVCAPVSTTAPALQVFGDAGAACFSIGGAGSAMDFLGRTGNSRILVIVTINLANSSGSTCWTDADIYLDSMATTLSITASETILSGLRINMVLVGYSAAVSGAAIHEVAVHATDQNGDGCTAQTGSMTIVDLGNTP